MRLGLLVAVATLLALLTAPGAAPKDGAAARLATSVPLDAAPGSTIRIVWTVTIPDGKGGRQAFGAGGMFVQFLTRTGVAAAHAFGSELQVGRYAAVATVPPGGIGGIRMGLRGTNDYGTADMLFPLENDPFLSKGGAHCDVTAVSAALHRFKGAFNRGDLPGLNALFSRDRFVSYSSGPPGLRTQTAARNRATLMAYFHGRHRQRDQVISFRLRFDGYDSRSTLGYFDLTGRRRADDFRSGRAFAFAGKGALDCAKRRVTIAALGVGAPAR